MDVYNRGRRAKTTGQRTSITDREGLLVHRLAQIIPSAGLAGDRRALHLGIGDDAALISASKDHEWALSCDASLEGVHFHQAFQPPDSIGYKSLARAASDLVAMGSAPSYFLLSLSLPIGKTGRWLDAFAAGMSRAARELGMKLVGGDISRSAKVAISITVIGHIAHGRGVLRSGARPGDFIYVSGRLGGAALGLEIVLRGPALARRFRKYLRPHFYPRVRVALGELLARRRIASAMMDLSDGLSTDLARLCAASRVGARVRAAQIPQVKIPAALSRLRFSSLDLALHGGEDYELLFIVPRKSASAIRRIRARIPLTCIGEITRARKILLVGEDGVASSLAPRGWDHFH